MPETELRSAIRNIRRDVWRDRVTLIDKPLTLPVLLSHARSSGAGLIVIDYLQAVDTGVPSESEYDAVTRTSKALKALALEMGAPVLALSQLSRAAKNGEPPSLTHLRASGQIEQDADQVWGLERDTTDDSRASQEVTVQSKNKTGPPAGGAHVAREDRQLEEWRQRAAAPDGRHSDALPVGSCRRVDRRTRRVLCCGSLPGCGQGRRALGPRQPTPGCRGGHGGTGALQGRERTPPHRHR